MSCAWLKTKCDCNVSCRNYYTELWYLGSLVEVQLAVSSHSLCGCSALANCCSVGEDWSFASTSFINLNTVRHWFKNLREMLDSIPKTSCRLCQSNTQKTLLPSAFFKHEDKDMGRCHSYSSFLTDLLHLRQEICPIYKKNSLFQFTSVQVLWLQHKLLCLLATVCTPFS